MADEAGRLVEKCADAQARIVLANQLVGRKAIDWVLSELKRDPGFDFYCLVDSAAAAGSAWPSRWPAMSTWARSGQICPSKT